MTNLVELYTDFLRIDLDARGGYARVADVVTHLEDGTPIHRAFKIMRHELDKKQVGIQRFENEIKILTEITKDKKAPVSITRIYDSGFAPVDLSLTMHNLHEDEKLSPNLEIISTGVNLQNFLETKSTLMEREPSRWLPYLVVELAPYNDSLLRQIKPKSVNDFLNLYRLPVDTIVEMTIQLLDVMEYLHKKLRYAYIDWKPEHIYWNESIKQLKLIDWNVTNRLTGNLQDKKTVREDIRMFCGAALYCSLALTDPEDLTKAIGPTPTIPRDLTPMIPPRYWTDRPNFYERDNILDEKIKQIVQKGLNPNQGFNSPSELKEVLMQYAEQRGKQNNEQGSIQNNTDLMAKLPVDSVQHYRRARSYIAAEDYSYAAISLELAIETAKVAGMNYSDAEKLLTSVQNILQAGEFRQKVMLAIELGQWEKAVTLYNKAIALEPTNTKMKKEYAGLQELIRSESKLRNKSLFRIFTNANQLQTILESTKEIIKPNNPLYSNVKQQLNQIKLIQFSSIFTFFIIVLFTLGTTRNFKFFGLVPIAATTTNTYTVNPLNTSTQTLPTLTPSATVPVTSTITVTSTLASTLTATNTLEPTFTPTSVIGYGVLNVSFFYPVTEPNGRRIGLALEINQFVTIVDKKMDREQLWYRCIWEINGSTGEGWILGANIQFAPPPTPTP